MQSLLMAGFSRNKGQDASETGMHNFLVSFVLQIWFLSAWLDFNQICAQIMYILCEPKANKGNVCIGFFPLL